MAENTNPDELHNLDKTEINLRLQDTLKQLVEHPEDIALMSRYQTLGEVLCMQKDNLQDQLDLARIKAQRRLESDGKTGTSSGRTSL